MSKQRPVMQYKKKDLRLMQSLTAKILRSTTERLITSVAADVACKYVEEGKEVDANILALACFETRLTYPNDKESPIVVYVSPDHSEKLGQVCYKVKILAQKPLPEVFIEDLKVALLLSLRACVTRSLRVYFEFDLQENES